MSRPTVSVVVPAYNAGRTLPRLLKTMAEGTDVPDEVIVVDDGSQSFEPVAQAGLPVRWVRLDHQGPIAARNAGWRSAKGEWIAFVDSDCSVTPGWCAAYRSAMETHPHAGILEGPLQETFRRGFFRHWAENPRPGRFPTANAAYRRDVLVELGGLDPRFRWGRFYFREDSDLALRAMRMGAAVWVSAAVVYHHGRAVGLVRKLQEACRYALDPVLVWRHGRRGLMVDGVRLGPLRIPAPRQISALACTLLWLAMPFCHFLWLPAALGTALRMAFVFSREGLMLREAPAAILEQVLEPFLLCVALVAGTVHVTLSGSSTQAPGELNQVPSASAGE